VRKSYPSYKESGVEWIGKVPVHWELLKIKNICFFGKGQGLSKTLINYEGKNKCILYGELFTIYKYLTKIDIVRSKTNKCGNIVSSGDEILIPGSTNTTGIDLSNAKYLPFKGIILGGDIIILYPRNNSYFQEYISLLLSSVSTPEFIFGARGVTIYHIYPKQIREISVSFPPLLEQNQIVKYLDYKTSLIDKLIEKTKKKIDLLKEKRTALINHCVTKGLNPDVEMKDSGIDWIGKIPFKWNCVPIKYILNKGKYSIRTGPFGSQLKTSDMVEAGIKIYNQRSVYDEDFIQGKMYIPKNKFEKLKGFEVRRGDILISSRGTIGKMAIVPEDAELGVLHPCLIRIRVNTDSLNKKYLWWYINHSSIFFDSVKYESNSTTIDVIYSNILTEIKFPLPPFSEQEQIIEYLDEQIQKIDTVIDKENKRIEFLKEYRKSLISEVVTGKIDVRDEVLA